MSRETSIPPCTIVRSIRRPSRIQSRVVDAIRQRVRSGKYTPGMRLPGWEKLAREFGTTGVTVQRAMRHLTAEGLVQVDGRRGTFVTGCPPHLYCCALVIPAARRGAGWSQYYESLSEAAEAVTRQTDWRIECHCISQGPDGHDPFAALCEEVRQHRLAGLIFPNPAGLYRGTPVLDEPGVPRVAVATVEPGSDVIGVEADWDGFDTQSLGVLRGRGRKRIAAIAFDPDCVPGDKRRRGLQRRCERQGLEMRRHWYMGASLGTARWAASWAELLMDQPDRPDGLIVLDDNLTAPVLEGLAHAGIRIGEDLDVVTHCNFPVTAKLPACVWRIGFDNRKLLALALDLIQRRRDGRPLPRSRKLPAVTEEWVPPGGNTTPRT